MQLFQTRGRFRCWMRGVFQSSYHFFRFKMSILFTVGHTYLLISALRMWWLMKHYPLVDIFFPSTFGLWMYGYCKEKFIFWSLLKVKGLKCWNGVAIPRTTSEESWGGVGSARLSPGEARVGRGTCLESFFHLSKIMSGFSFQESFVH